MQQIEVIRKSNFLSKVLSLVVESAHAYALDPSDKNLIEMELMHRGYEHLVSSIPNYIRKV